MTSLQRYIDSIKAFGRITKDEEKQLARIIFYSRKPERVIEAKEKMAHCNLLLVVDRALRFSNLYGLKESDTMDLISEGNIGLVRAVELYKSNHESGAGFATYAIYHIDQKIIRFAKHNKILYIPEHFLKLRKKMDELEFKYKDKLTNKIIRKELDISQEVIEVLRDERSRPILFLEDVFNEEEGKKWTETLKDESAPSPYKENCIKSLRGFLDKYLGLLDERERKIIKCIHYSEKEMTLDNISKIVHVSRERVRQIYLTSLRKLKIYIIKGFYAEREKKNEKHIRYGRRRYTHKTTEELERCVEKIMADVYIL